MIYFKTHKNGQIRCLLCSHYCTLKEGETGLCKVNKNIENKLQCLVYGRVDAINIDPIEKKPLYHFLPNSKSLSIGTVGCNFKCDFCQNWQLSQSDNFTKERYLNPQKIVQLAIHYRCKSISFTYNEPTIFYPYAKDIAQEAKKSNIKSVFVTNGFESKEIIEDMLSTANALNIDLKSFSKSYYKEVLKGNLHVVLKNITKLVEKGLHVELTTLVVPTQNDSINEIKSIINFIKNLNPNIPWHILAFHPNYKQINLPSTSKEFLYNIYSTAKQKGLNHVYMGNIGIENPTYCPKCNKILIQRRHFKIEYNNLVNNTCPSCHTIIQGVFS